MNKTYTFQKKLLREDLNDRTLLDYYLTDDDGNQRVVSAVAKLGYKNKVKSIVALYHREAPLVDVLKSVKQYQKIEVSFSKSGKKPRFSIVPADMELASSMMLQSENSELSYDQESSSISPSFTSLGILAVLAYILWFVSKSVGI